MIIRKNAVDRIYVLKLYCICDKLGWSPAICNARTMGSLIYEVTYLSILILAIV